MKIEYASGRIACALPAEPAVIVAAHPDDEAIGLGAHLREIRRLAAIVHITDGAPRVGGDVRNAGCGRWEEYATLRRREFERALEVSEAHTRSGVCLWCPDQEATVRIAELVKKLVPILGSLRPAVVFTHPYEGGHPDHDATAAAVYAARRISGLDFSIFEYASYHASATGMACECFLKNGTEIVWDQPLTAKQRERKRKIFECYESQRQVLQQFPILREPVRVAPEYDFARPPHEGGLFYEQFEWGMTGNRWRHLVSVAFRDLAIQ
jgi:N-acetylglucosamine malate deacetylase 2